MEAQYFNHRSAYVDGNFGIAYASSKLTLQAAMPNLKNVFFTNNDQRLDVDRSTFYSAASYRFDFENESGEYSIEPKIAYRGIKSFNNILDAGANFALKDDNISFSEMYHSNRSFTLGLGLNLQAMDLLIAYTDNVGPLATYANNTFELGIKLKLFR